LAFQTMMMAKQTLCLLLSWRCRMSRNEGSRKILIGMTILLSGTIKFE
jgi:hypothetical protein